MNDCGSYKGLRFGFTVTSAKKKTVAITTVDYYDKTINELFFPKKIKLGDGRIYKVTAILNDCMCPTGRIRNIIIPKTITQLSEESLINNYIQTYWDSGYRSITIKSKKLKPEDLFKSFDGIGYVKKIIIKVSNNKKINRKYIIMYRKALKNFIAQTHIKKIS